MPETPSPERIVHEARARSGAARADYLSDACGSSSALRAQVEALLAADQDAGPFFQEGADLRRHELGEGDDLDATIPNCRPAEAAAHVTEQAGQIIGRYKLFQQVGEGGFGSVWMAEQREPVVRKVALKIIKLGMDTRQVIARFEAERQALALMDHPHIAKVLDAGATETGRPFFVMEFCAGDSITRYCDRHNLAIPERLNLLAQVCQAVQHAHQKGIIHRDLKPSNILVSTQDGRPHARVIDFGIAKATFIRLTEMTLFTENRQLIGTPQYMSPEQAEGSLDIDTRTDVYSLGVLLYELLTGVTPFDPQKLRSAACGEVQRMIREDEPPKPSTRVAQNSTTIVSIAAHRCTEPRKLGTIIRGDLDWITLKAMEKDRTRRYETANALAMDILRHLRNEPVAAGAPGPAYRLRKFVRRNRAGVIAGALLAAVLVLGVIGTTSGLVWALREKSRANDETRKATLAADTAERAAYQAQIVSAAHAIEDQRTDAAAPLLAATSPRLRGWEYRHLVSRLDRTLPSPFPADWRILGLVTAAASGRVAVHRSVGNGPLEWVVLDGDLRTERLVMPDTVPASLGLSPDGARAVWAPPATDVERSALLWNIETNAALATIPIENQPSRDSSRVVMWSVSGDRFVISHLDGYQVHDGRTGARLHSERTGGYAYFTGDDRWMLLHGEQHKSVLNARDFNGREFRLLDARTLEPGGEVLRFDSPVSQISFRQSRVACASEDGTLRLLEIVDGALRERSTISAGIASFNAPSWSADGRLIAIGSVATGRVRVWDTDSGALRGDFGGPQSGVATQWFLPDSGDLCACDLTGRHRVWPMRTASGGVLTAHKSYVYAAVVSQDGSLLLTGGWDGLAGHGGGLKLWDARTGALVTEYGRSGDIFLSASLTPDGRFAVASIRTERESDRRTEVIDLATGAVRVFFLPAKSTPPLCTVVHPDGRRVISTCASGEALVWDLATGNVLWQTEMRPKVDSSSISVAAAVSLDGRLLALADRQLGIRLVNTDTYSDVRRWDAHTDGIWSLSFSPDGKRLLSASDDQTVGVWDVATGALVTRLEGHGAKVLCATMSPDGARIASGGRDGIVRLWDTTHFDNVAQLSGHTDYVYCLVWSPDGQQLISTSGDFTVRIWDTRTLAEQLAAVHARSEALPHQEARITRARADATDPDSAVHAAIAAPELSARERELVRQVAAHFASTGTPAYYRAPRAAAPIVIDGRIDEAAWSAAPWSEAFVDIEGSSKPKPRFETRMRMAWDDTNLYIAAQLDEPHVSATLTERDSIVLRDNDFEVFIDPDGDSCNYYELEFNAHNALFDLLLVRAYRDGGPAKHDWNLAGVRSAVHVDGSLNDPRDVDRGWTLEMALPWSSLAEYATCPSPPHPGDVWRVNFSRVEWRYEVVDGHYVKRPETQKEDNWVWTPQHVVNMHVPERWGFVKFMALRE